MIPLCKSVCLCHWLAKALGPCDYFQKIQNYISGYSNVTDGRTTYRSIIMLCRELHGKHSSQNHTVARVSDQQSTEVS